MPDGSAEMIEILEQVRPLLEASEESIWTALTPQQVIALIDEEIAQLRSKGHFKDRVKLASLFAPTAEIQEISMANGWGGHYLELSTRFDTALELCR